MTDRTDPFLRLIDALYEAIDAPEQWETTWRGLMRYFGAETGCLYLEAPPAEMRPVTFLAMPGFSEHALSLYGSHYINVDPYAASYRFLPTAEVFLSQCVISPDRFRETEVWRDYSRHYVGAFHIIGGIMPSGGGEFARTAIHRPHDMEAFDATDQSRYARLLPHLSRSLQLRSKLLCERQALGNYQATLDSFVSAIAVVNGFARHSFCNAAAERLSANRHIVLGRTGSEIRLPSDGESRRLRILIEDVARGGPGGAMVATGADGQTPIAISVSRLPDGAYSHIPVDNRDGTYMVLLILRDLRTALRLDPRALVNLFKFTMAEAEVARDLVDGVCAEDIAHSRRRSIATVRTQIRHVLSKTGATSTTHLVAMLSRLRD